MPWMRRNRWYTWPSFLSGHWWPKGSDLGSSGWASWFSSGELISTKLLKWWGFGGFSISLHACKIKDGEAYSCSLPGIFSSMFSYQDFVHTSFDIVTSTVDTILLWSNDYNASFPTPPCTIITMNEPFLASSSNWHRHRSNSIAETEKKRYPRRPQHQLYSSKNNHDIMCIPPN